MSFFTQNTTGTVFVLIHASALRLSSLKPLQLVLCINIHFVHLVCHENEKREKSERPEPVASVAGVDWASVEDRYAC